MKENGLRFLISVIIKHICIDNSQCLAQCVTIFECESRYNVNFNYLGIDPKSWHFNGYKDHHQLPHLDMRLVSEYWHFNVISTRL